MSGLRRPNDSGGHTPANPRALIHRKILDAADGQPGASMAAIADHVDGASTDLVERVLSEYGDPGVADDSTDTVSSTASDSGQGSEGTDLSPSSGSVTTTDGGESTRTESEGGDGGDDDSATTGATAMTAGSDSADNTEADGLPDPDALRPKERAVIEAIAARPDATQAELADELGVSRATISKRVNGIDGFDWRARKSFVRDVADHSTTMQNERQSNATTDGSGTDRPGAGQQDGPTAGQAGAQPDRGGDDRTRIEAELARLASRVDALEAQTDRDDACSRGLQDPSLAHKVVHACVQSDHLSDEEELRVLETLLEGTR